MSNTKFLSFYKSLGLCPIFSNPKILDSHPRRHIRLLKYFSLQLLQCSATSTSAELRWPDNGARCRGPGCSSSWSWSEPPPACFQGFSTGTLMSRRKVQYKKNYIIILTLQDCIGLTQIVGASDCCLSRGMMYELNRVKWKFCELKLSASKDSHYWILVILEIL